MNSTIINVFNQIFKENSDKLINVGFRVGTIDIINNQFIVNVEEINQQNNIPFQKVYDNQNLVYNQKTDSYDCKKNISIPKELVKDGKLLINLGKLKGNIVCLDNLIQEDENGERYYSEILNKDGSLWKEKKKYVFKGWHIK